MQHITQSYSFISMKVTFIHVTTLLFMFKKKFFRRNILNVKNSGVFVYQVFKCTIY